MSLASQPEDLVKLATNATAAFVSSAMAEREVFDNMCRYQDNLLKDEDTIDKLLNDKRKAVEKVEAANQLLWATRAGTTRLGAP